MTDHGRTTHRNAALRHIPIKASGIYLITNTKDGKFYIGSACDIRKRLRHHLIALRGGSHSNRHLQCAFNRDGESVFAFEVLTICDKAILISREQEFLDFYKCYDDRIGYNINPRADSVPVLVYNDEMRAVISARFKGKPKSAEHRKKISEAQKIRTCPEEKRKQISESLKKYFSDPANRAAQSVRQTGVKRRGTPCSEERKRKLSEQRIGIVKPGLRKHQPEEIRQWIAMKKAGMTWFAIATAVNVPPSFVQRCIKRYLKELPDGTHDTEQRQGMAQPVVHHGQRVADSPDQSGQRCHP